MWLIFNSYLIHKRYTRTLVKWFIILRIIQDHPFFQLIFNWWIYIYMYIYIYIYIHLYMFIYIYLQGVPKKFAIPFLSWHPTLHSLNSSPTKTFYASAATLRKKTAYISTGWSSFWIKVFQNKVLLLKRARDFSERIFNSGETFLHARLQPVEM